MQIYKNLYVSDGLKGKEDSILTKIQQKQVLINTYLIVIPKNKQHQLEIYNVALSHQNNFPLDAKLLVGIAGGFGEALDLVTQITGEVYEGTGDANLRSYLIRKQNEQRESEV